MHPAFAETEHRPFALPTGRWVWRQRWLDVLLLHWPVAVERLRPFVPRTLAIQEHGGTSWVGLVPFRMAGVSRRLLPDLPGLSAFPELNLRLYVERDGKPGVWFISLDAASALAVWAGRRLYHLPYHRARMAFARSGDSIRFSSERRGAEAIGFTGEYRPRGEERIAPAGGLEHFLTERYCLYAQSRDGSLFRTDVHHVPWPLGDAEVEIAREAAVASQGLPVEGPPVLQHFSRGVDVVAWPPVRVHPPP